VIVSPTVKKEKKKKKKTELHTNTHTHTHTHTYDGGEVDAVPGQGHDVQFVPAVDRARRSAKVFAMVFVK
jgi:hypothetical protein